MSDESNNDLIDILSAIYVQSLRIYDILMLSAQKLGVDIEKLEEMHENGKVLCPDPKLIIDDEDNSPE
ncbi:MAG: hypothetical protein EBX40_07615 [Gammaproteobacteria bacterium]|nr:hypothetical protein [Gammaproteobacteria bacterium]